uniref:Uncharacterized protein n=1 Tax=Rhodosorus marinus TaxID=101924 RepID=A0A7S0G345_9RHOD|mmetsp:Transcript_24585/g.35451  ORF Transcript_24585/g.35451 Transcript_24585/m.35451 type:complete len:212 (+) Transcript_24585:102-737(+)
MEDLYRDAKRGVRDSQVFLERLEQDPSFGNADFEALRGTLEALRVAQVQLGQNFNSEPAHKREIWRQKLLQLEQNIVDLYQRQERCLSKARAAQSEQRIRDELLGRRSQANGGDTTIQIDGYEAEAKSLNRSSTMSDQIVETGSNIVEMLHSQRQKLKGAKKKVLDMANQLGVSKELIRSIERRELADTYLVFGFIGLLILIILIIWWVRR